jgi:hypothetical protein
MRTCTYPQSYLDLLSAHGYKTPRDFCQSTGLDTGKIQRELTSYKIHKLNIQTIVRIAVALQITVDACAGALGFDLAAL